MSDVVMCITLSSTHSEHQVRLAEITEELCRDVGRGETQCHQQAGEWEEQLEQWWGQAPDSRGPLRQWLCVDHLKVPLPSPPIPPSPSLPPPPPGVLPLRPLRAGVPGLLRARPGRQGLRGQRQVQG